MEAIIKFALLIAWVAGFVIAKGFWPTLFCVIPFWSFYLVVEKVMTVLGWL
ncbi:TMhelix containing protein [Vibrio phage 1.072.O._10N.286.48.A12]|nr:TMhelix containing protein [Vibrio phage 1.004.O._10N.261.54.A2]AUR83564.1 TMhelix containing protein [Vibrio phage 1.037.O._10N.261.52.F7]AUR84447.1 TMhelix containing protein [Vibrio phage 1.056.O._10N.261.48.C11]AUR84964.1 TMhelix containing protein [Vibrio phage 1.066.O._10N.286.46.E8]AUR85095.1 TMhelix containing protein [Vibrio phage 1.068.O._10N.261.51.F8]AUR85322.1 TMhelix containing protein [Vibrio phage 1.072.O._10N.286.48.A12]